MSTDDNNTTSSPLVRQMEDIVMNDEEILNEEAWEDKKIDSEAKNLLRQRRLGQILANDTVAHLEFFYNTLLMDHNTDNPFEKPD